MESTFIPYLLGADFSLIVGVYVGYLLWLRTASSHRMLPRTEPFRPSVCMIVPVYNESKIIEKKIDNIKNISYPKDKFEVVFVDGNSSDRTPTLIQEHISSADSHIRLISQPKREGVYRAIVMGILKSNSEIVALTDGAAYHDPEAMTHLVDHLSDPEVGVVTGKAVIVNQDEGFLPKLEVEYRNFQDFVRLAESRIDSTPETKGELLVARREICMRLVPKLNQLERGSFDVCLSYQAKLDGFRAIYEPNARFYEYAPSSLRDRLKVKTLRAGYFVGALISFRSMLFNREYGDFGRIILPARLMMLVIVPWLVLASIALLIADVFLDPIFALPLWTAFAIAILSKRIRVLAASFGLSQIALAAGELRLLFGRTSQMVDSASSTRR
jgi:cellulose synthase/poly-beta-1,6-N-acetylglucosamine synthase-like glycosyltransferase